MVFKIGNIACALLVFLALTPSASAWAWPVEGPVLRPFVDGSDPYARGQHRGIDIGAPTGTDVRSAANGIVSFVGQLPHQGLCLTVRTADGYSVTLVHLGSIGVTTGTQVSEGDVVGTIGPTGDVEGTEPYVYLGIRLTADPNGYLDPLTLLPPRHAPEQPPVSQQQTPAPQPVPPVVHATAPRVVPKHLLKPTPSRAPRRPVARGRAKAVLLVRAVSPDRSAVPTPRAPSRTAPAPRPSQRVRANDRPTVEPAQAPPPARPQGHAPPAESVLARASTAEGARVVARPEQLQRHGSRRPVLIAMALVGCALVAAGLLRRQASQPLPIAPRPLRKMSVSEPVPEDRLPEPSPTAHSRRRRVALRDRKSVV